MNPSFAPSLLLRNRHVQTILGSRRPIGKLPFPSEPTILNLTGGGRLLGYFSRHASNHQTLGLVAILHGWEGSADSAYMRSMAAHLYANGFNVFRLNLRDHGDSHHLNEGLFHGALTDEVCDGVDAIGQLIPGAPLYLVGFSLGGNFALRVALAASRCHIPSLHHVLAICPAMDPYRATVRIDQSLSLYRYYFLAKWKRSLRKKQALFPDRYDFSGLLHARTCMDLTAAMFPTYNREFSHYRDYFAAYTLTGNVLATMQTPVTILAAKDDPIIPYEDIEPLPAVSPAIRLLATRYGGHCGFVQGMPLKAWHEFLAVQIFTEIAGKSS